MWDSKFELQSRYYFLFRTYNSGKGMNHRIPQVMVQISSRVSVILFYKNGFNIKEHKKVDMPLKPKI